MTDKKNTKPTIKNATPRPEPALPSVPASVLPRDAAPPNASNQARPPAPNASVTGTQPPGSGEEPEKKASAKPAAQAEAASQEPPKRELETKAKPFIKNETRTKLTELIQEVHKAFGVESISVLDHKPAGEFRVIPSGSRALDQALGIGGYPRGRIIEIYGPESSGKTTLTLHAVAEVQRAGGVAAFIDAEHAFDVRYARSIGVDPATLLISQPDSGEQALEIAHILAKNGGVDLIVIDSVAALVPRAEIEGEMGDPHMGLQARLMSQALRKLTGVLNKQDTTFIFINQLRQKIGVVMGNPETTTGGNALKFYASVRLDVRRTGKVTVGEDVVGNRTRVKVVKNKCAQPFTEAEFDIRWGTGIDLASDLLETATAAGVVQKNGAHYAFLGSPLGHGKEKTRDVLLDSPALRQQIAERLVAERKAA
ncbi:MAG TPA: recombinase RecA [Polyangiaceae bacterium]|nr:recombinase RecA [Polyangiaceae bacterium]